MTSKPASILPHRFYDRDVLEVARDLLGMRLVRSYEGQRISGIITETEAYDGQNDLACHARMGMTRRNAVMFGPAGHAYVYFTYGMHWCLNCVARGEGYAAAVLIRAILPTEGIDLIARRRSPALQKNWTNGPAKLTSALGIDGQFNGVDICAKTSLLYIERCQVVPASLISTAARVGINSVPEPWRSQPWRFIAHLPAEWDAGSPPHSESHGINL